MARFTEDTIERLKNEVSLIRLLKSQGFELKKQGKDYLCRCPFHNDKTPSLVVSPDKNLWHCLGACGTGGSVIDWVMKSEGVSFKHAVELLKNDFAPLAVNGMESVNDTGLIKRTTIKKLDAPLTVEADEQQALKNVIHFYHETLKQSPEVIEYLDSRGLNNNELINEFKLGYANRSLGYRLPEKNRQAGAELRGKLQSIGILRNSGHEHFNGSLVVPVFSCEGLITEVYGRKINRSLRKGTAHHLYLPGAHMGVWNESALRSDEVILCESLIDAMTFWVNGFRNVTTSYGVNGFTNDILNALINNQVKRVLIAYDRDDAGNQAADDLAKQLKRHGIDSFRVNFPKGMDANEYALSVQPASKALGLVIRKAEPLLDAIGLSDPIGSKQLAKAKPEKEPSSPIVLDKPIAEVQPKAPNNIDAEVSEREIKMAFGERLYRVRGLSRNLSYDQLKVNVMVSENDDVHVDTLELYNAKQRQTFIKIAASELNCEAQVIKKDLGKVLLKLEELQEQHIENTLEPKEKTIELDDSEKAEALALLKDKNLLTRILDDFNQCGVVGEETNKLVGYLAGVSRKLDKPLAVIIQSSSAAGKSSLMDAVLNLMPEEERVQYSAMTGQSLYYLGETNLKNKILAIAEEEGAEHASYALKLLQSEGEINIASTGKNATTGNLETQTYHVEGPVMLFLTTTAIDIDEELLNRCLVLTVNESREQTEAIHHQQRIAETLEGMRLKQKKDHLVKLHRNAQRLLKPLAVVNPYAEHLTFLSHQTRTRRDHQKYLALIRSIAFLHQYQRSIKTDNGLEYIEVTLEDIAMANQLAHEVLGRTLDELPPQTRKLLSLITEYVKTECEQQGIEQSDFRFSRKQLRDELGWSDTALKVHLSRLTDFDYLVAHTNGHRQRFHYELLYTGSPTRNDTFLNGLIDVEQLGYDKNRSGLKGLRSASGQGVVGGQSGTGQGDKNTAKLNGQKASTIIDIEEHQSDLFTVNESPASYVSIPSLTGR